MQEVKPYSSIDEALKALDNGGRFYNIFTKADDGLISKSELSKIAGLFSGKQRMMLFLELSLSKMTTENKQQIIEKLDTGLQKAYQSFKPKTCSVKEVLNEGTISSNTIITGIPKLKSQKDEFKGFVITPVAGPNHITTFTLTPIIDQYDVYELKDESSDESLVIAHVRGTEKLPEKRLSLAGVLKELQVDKNEDSASDIFMEAVYYLEID